MYRASVVSVFPCEKGCCVDELWRLDNALRSRSGKTEQRHRVHFTFKRSHWSMHSTWKLWAQGKPLTCKIQTISTHLRNEAGKHRILAKLMHKKLATPLTMLGKEMFSTSCPIWSSSKQIKHSPQSSGTAFNLNFGSSRMSASTASVCFESYSR